MEGGSHPWPLHREGNSGVWNVECGVRIPSGVVPFAPILFLDLLPYLIIISHSTFHIPHSSSLSIISHSTFHTPHSSKNVSLPKGILPPMRPLITAQFHLHLSTVRQGDGLPLPAFGGYGKHRGATQRCEEGIDYLSTWFHLQYSSPYRLFSKFLEISN